MMELGRAAAPRRRAAASAVPHYFLQLSISTLESGLLRELIQQMQKKRFKAGE